MKDPEFAESLFCRSSGTENAVVRSLAISMVWGFRYFQILAVWMCLLPAPAKAAQAAPADYLISIVRHGDRSPRELGAQAYLWPVGAGQLTTLGMSQMVTLGQEIRQHYFGAKLPEVWFFNLSQHFAKGTYRTIQSASALLQGFFPVSANKTGLPENIQLPPVLSSPIEKDLLFSAQHICPGYVRLIQGLEKTPRWMEKRREYGDRFNYWQKLAGVDGGIYSLAGFMDRVAIHAMHNLPMPDGITPQDTRALTELLDWLLASLAREHNLAQLVIAPLVTRMMDNFQQIALCLNSKESSKAPCTKWVLYLGSDINLISFLSLLGLPRDKNVRYGAHLEMKLNWDATNPEVSLFFNHIPLDVPGCGTSCHLDIWLEILDNTQPASWESLCNINSGPILNDSNLSHPLPDGQSPREINKN